jgi:membrane protease YdiL (CAAX protease family)
MSTIAAPNVLDGQQRLPSGTGPIGVIRGHPMASFLFLIFALTWIFQIPWIASTEGWLPFEFPFPLLFVMGWMPGVAAVIVTGATSGRAGVRSLFGRILIWRVGFKWYLFPIFGSAALWTAALALDPLLGGAGLQLPAFSVDLLVGAMITLVLIFLINSEEIAWRGFAMPRLQARHSALAASLFLGVFEGLFHLPYFFRSSSDQAAAGLPVFMIGTLAGAVIFTWLFNNTRGSVLLVMLFHTFTNMWIEVFPAPPADQAIAQWCFNALLVILALVLVAVFGAARLSRKSASEMPVLVDSA